jgi:hypothetical protein
MREGDWGLGRGESKDEEEEDEEGEGKGDFPLDISRQLSAVQLISSSESGDISRGRDRERGGGYGASIPRGDLP